MIQLTGNDFLAKELMFMPVDFNDSEFELKDVTIGVNFNWEQKENKKFQGALKLMAKTSSKGDVTFLAVSYDPMFDGDEAPDVTYKYLLSWMMAEGISGKFALFTEQHETIQIQEN